MKYLVTKHKFALKAIDAVGKIIFSHKKKSLLPKNPKKVLFIRLEHIGDVILATPTFETFKKNNPKCEVHVLCRNLTAPILKNNPSVDRIITFDAPWFLKRANETKKSVLEMVEKLKAEKYDLVFEMHGDPRSNLFVHKIGAYSIGYPVRGGGFFLNRIKHYDPKMRMIDQNLKLIEDFVSPKKIIRDTKVFTDKESLFEVKKIMKKHSLSKNKFIIINPKSGRPEKDLTTDEVKLFVEECKKKYKNCKFVFTGAKEDLSFVEPFLFKGSINLCGATSLLGLCELVRNSKLVFAPDTAIVHMSHAVGTKCICIYKTTDRAVYGY